MAKYLRRVGSTLLFLLSGTSLGWLVGLSSSPTVATVLAALLAVIATILSSGNGETDGTVVKRLFSLRPIPTLVLSIGVALGATAGLLVRTHDWLSPSPAELVGRWTANGMLEKEFVARALLARLQDSSEGALTAVPIDPSRSVLWQGQLDRCRLLQNEGDTYDRHRLGVELEEAGGILAEMDKAIADLETLRRTVTSVCRYIAMEATP